MKYIATILLLTLALASKSQTFINRAGAANTVIDARLGAAQNFYLPRLRDTILSGGMDTIGNLIYDRLRAKIAIRDTVLTGGHKFTFLFKTEDTLTTLATKYDLTQLSGVVIANNGLTNNVDSVQFGQAVGAVGSPGALHNNREVPLSGFGIAFTGTGGISIGTSSISSGNKLNIVGTGTERAINATAATNSAINAISTGASTTIFGQNQGTGAAVSGSSSGSSGYGVVATSSANGAIALRVSNFNTNNNSSAPVIAEYERNANGGAAADGIGMTIMFKSQTTNSSGIESGQLRNYFSTVLHGSRSSAFELHLINNAVSARKVLLSSTGQWTWDGYPALPQQTDSTNIKPLGYNVSTGAIQPMANWIGGGGGAPSLTATEIAFGGPGNTMTSSPFLNYISATHYLTADTIRNSKNIVDTTLYMPFVLIPNGQRYAAIGDSYTVGTAATVIPDSAYTGRFSEYYSLPLDNYAITGVGAVTSTYQHFVNINYPNASLTGAMFGLNNLRYGGADRKTINKILNGYKNIFCNQFSKTFYPASNTTVVTRHGSWTTGWASNSGGGKAGTQGAFTNTINDSIKYNFTDSTVWFSVIAGDGSGSIYTSPTIDVYIDGILQETVSLNEQTDGQIDGSFDGRLIPFTRYYTGLTYGAHTLRVVNKSSLYLLFDGFGTLIDRSLANSYIIWHVPKLNPTGYLVPPTNGSDPITDTMNVKIDSLYATFPSWYPVYVARSNDYFDPHAGMSADSVHPNNLGHHQLFDAALAILGSSSISVETGSVFRANDNLYLKRQSELAKIVTGDAVFNQGQIIFNDTMRIGSLNDKPVAIISNGQTAASFRQNQGVYGNVADFYGPTRAFGPVYAEAANIELKRGWAFSGGISNSIGTWTGGGAGWGFSENYIGVANSRFWGLMTQENGFFGRLVADNGTTFTNWLDVRRNGIHADSITFSMGKIFLGEMTEASASDSALDWNRSTQQIVKVPKSSKVTLLTSSAGTLLLGNTEAYVFNGTTTTWTLPAVSGTTGMVYYIKNIGSGSITLNADSGNNEIYSTSAVNTLTIAAGSSIMLLSNGTYFTTVD